MKGKFIDELEPGQGFSSSVFAIRDVALKQSSTGNDYMICLLSDRTGSRRAKMWNVPNEQYRRASISRLVCVDGEIQLGEYHGEVVIKAFESVEIPEDLSDFLPALRENYLAQHKRFRDMIATVEHPHLRMLLDKVFDPEGATWQPFCHAVAAKQLHHAYHGGLLDHTLEVARLCHVTCHVIKSLRRDFLVTCALLHDIGKLEEMDHELATGEYSAVGSLLGHTVLGMQFIAATCDTIAGFPADLKHGVMHMILSHHGKAEFGAAKPPLCAEAQVLSANDLLSARLDQCDTVSKTAVDGKHSAPIYGWDSKFVHTGDFGLLTEPANIDIG